MQSTTGAVVTQLEHLLADIQQMEARYTGEVIALQNILNRTCKTQPANIHQQKTHQQPKVEPQEISMNHEIDAMMQEIQIKQQMLEHNPRQKLQIKPPEPVVEKKPALPTVNRSQKNVRHQPTYIPPRNKNEVTGKVTQTTIRTTNQKTFKPDLTGFKRSASREILNKGTVKARPSVQAKTPKLEQKKQEPVKKVPLQKNQPVKQVQIPPKRSQVENKHKPQLQIQKRLTTMNKNPEELYEQLRSKGHHNRKHILQKLIKECETQEFGHRKNEQTSRLTFICHANNYSISRNNVCSAVSHKIARQKWHYHPSLFELGSLLQNVEKEVFQFQSLEDYRPDPKQEFKIIQTINKVGQILQTIERDKGTVPEHLSLSFSHSEMPKIAVPQQEGQQINELQLNQCLNNILEELSQATQLQKSHLRGVQVLAQVGMLKSKRSPTLAMQKDYDMWRDNYFNSQIQLLFKRNDSSQPQ